MNLNFKLRSRSTNYRQIKKKLTSFADIINLRYQSSKEIKNPDKSSDTTIPLPSNYDDHIELYQNPGPSQTMSTFDNREENCSSLSGSENIFVNVDENESEKISSNSSESESESYFDQNSFKNMNAKEFLVYWYLQFNISHVALSMLLKWLSTNPDCSTLPKDARTLLKTPIKVNIEQQGDGMFHYFGIEKTLSEIFTKFSNVEILKKNDILLDFCIDGIPLHKSTNTSFWPIICRIYSFPKVPLFPVAIYCGNKKPPLNNFLEKFVQEMKELQTRGLLVSGVKLLIKVRAICCDAPARAFLKNTKGHNAFFGCDRCMVQGESYDRRIVFLDLFAPKRSNENFRNQINSQHHKGITPLQILDIDLVADFPLDYMHCVCLGVMRKLLFLWRDGSRLYRICGESLTQLDNHMRELQKVWPIEFNRKPRSITELERWKASELRQFLLYSGPVILKNILANKYYGNFMLLNFAITILLSNNYTKENSYIEFASKLLKVFVKHAITLYGKEFCVYNVHILTHITDDAKKYGSLNSINCFPFENYLQTLKKMLRKSNLPLQQVVRRLAEKSLSVSEKIEKESYVSKKISNLQCIPEEIQNKFGKYSFFEMFHTPNATFSNKPGNNIIFISNKDSTTIIEIICFIQTKKSIKIIGQKIKIIRPFTLYPQDSSFLLFYEVSNENSNEIFEVNANDILYKGILLPLDDKKIIRPLLHDI